MAMGSSFLSRGLPFKVMKKRARFSTTPIFLRPPASSEVTFRVLTMRSADFCPIPGTLRRVP